MTDENISNIDDLLIGSQGNTQQPATPEHYDTNESHAYEEDGVSEGDTSEHEVAELSKNDVSDDEDVTDNAHEESEKSESNTFDDYGNPTENMTEGMKKRLKKQADKYESRIQALESQIAQLTPRQHQELQQAAKEFNSNPNSDDDWQQQFTQMVEKTIYDMSIRQQQAVAQSEQMRIEKEFERKLFAGMDRFNDFKETIRDVGCEITNHMTNATRSLDDPAAFLYAAAKRHPDELKRISSLQDPYAQAREMGKLEERMRKNKSSSNAPKTLGKIRADASFPSASNKKEEESIESLIAKSDAKRLAVARARYGRR